MEMTTPMAARALDADIVARELGNWRTSSRSGPTYQGLADGLRMLVVDGRLPVGARLPSERALADELRVSRTTVTAAYTELRDDGYLHARRGARSTIALPHSPAVPPADAPAAVNLAVAALSAPASAVQEAFAEAARQSAGYLQHTGHDMKGLLTLRTAIAERYCDRGLPTTPEQVMVTSGAQHAIALIVATYTQPGDRVLVEQPTYHGALTAIGTAGARAVPVPVSNDGWDLDAMHAAVRQLAPTLAYLVPDNHNPTGMSLPAADRKRLCDIISETRTRTVIDETLTDVWLDEPVPAPVAASMSTRADLMMTIGSMSKSFWGGMRIGWIRAEPSVLATIRGHAPLHRPGHLGDRTARRDMASHHTGRRRAARAPGDPAGTQSPAAGAARPAPAGMAAAAGHRRHVAVGAAARPGQLGDVRLGVPVGGGVAAGARASASTAPWNGSSGSPTCCPRSS